MFARHNHPEFFPQTHQMQPSRVAHASIFTQMTKMSPVGPEHSGHYQPHPPTQRVEKTNNKIEDPDHLKASYIKDLASAIAPACFRVICLSIVSLCVLTHSVHAKSVIVYSFSGPNGNTITKNISRQIRSARVLSAGSYRKAAASMGKKAAIKKLGIAAFVRGSVRPRGNGFLLTIRVISASTGKLIGSKQVPLLSSRPSAREISRAAMSANRFIAKAPTPKPDIKEKKEPRKPPPRKKAPPPKVSTIPNPKNTAPAPATTPMQPTAPPRNQYPMPRQPVYNTVQPPYQQPPPAYGNPPTSQQPLNPAGTVYDGEKVEKSTDLGFGNDNDTSPNEDKETSSIGGFQSESQATNIDTKTSINRSTRSQKKPKAQSSMFKLYLGTEIYEKRIFRFINPGQTLSNFGSIKKIPAVRVNIDYHPLATVDSGFASNIGLRIHYDQVFGLQSGAVNPSTKAPTRMWNLETGLLYRIHRPDWPLLPIVNMAIGYGVREFVIKESKSLATGPLTTLPDLRYQYLYVTPIDLTWIPIKKRGFRGGLFGSGSYRYALTAGKEKGFIENDKNPGYGKATTIQGFAGQGGLVLGYKWLTLRAGIGFQQFAIKFSNECNKQSTGCYVAASALDQMRTWIVQVGTRY